jgi:hypothetical protein
VQQRQRGPREELRRPAFARHPEAMLHVCDGLLEAERPDVPAEGDALVQLRELGIHEERPELRLADEDEPEKLLGRGLEVGEEPQLLEQLDRERLRLVHDDDGELSRPALREEVRIERIHELHLAARRRDAELAVDALEQLASGQRRIEDVCGADVRPELGEERAQQGRLPGTDVAGDADEAARFREPEAQMGERLGMLRGQEQVAGIRCQPKRKVVQPEEVLVDLRHTASAFRYTQTPWQSKGARLSTR